MKLTDNCPRTRAELLNKVTEAELCCNEFREIYTQIVNTISLLDHTSIYTSFKSFQKESIIKFLNDNPSIAKHALEKGWIEEEKKEPKLVLKGNTIIDESLPFFNRILEFNKETGEILFLNHQHGNSIWKFSTKEDS